jgi:D-sedoheptulose 7-phosphate isomerase
MRQRSRQLFEQFFTTNLGLGCCRNSVEAALNILVECFRRGNKLLVCGNGGSAADAEHIVGELMKGYKLPRTLEERKLSLLRDLFPDEGQQLGEKLQEAHPAISLVSQTSLCTAIANDTGAAMVFAQQVYGYGIAGDVLLAISTSGEAKNVTYAVKTSKAFDLKTIGLTGKADSPLSGLCDVTIQVPAVITDQVQEYHMKVYHHLCAVLEVEFFGGE